MPEGATLLADKGYYNNAICEAAASKNAWANIPSRSNGVLPSPADSAASATWWNASSTASSTSEACHPLLQVSRKLLRRRQTHLCQYLVCREVSLRPSAR